MTGELYRDTGVVLRTYKLAESDRIVVIITAEHGKVRAVAKGVRKTKSKFGARLEPMSHVRLLLYRGRELDIVSQAESVEPLAPMLATSTGRRRALPRSRPSTSWRSNASRTRSLYRMVVGVLRTIAAAPSPLNVSAFYWKLLAAEGLEPQLDECVRCGEIRARRGVRGVRCQRGRRACAGTCRSGTASRRRRWRCMRDILGGRLNEALAVDGITATHEVSTLATRALEHHIERRLRAVAMFEAH